LTTFQLTNFVCIADDSKLHTIRADNTHKPTAIQRTLKSTFVVLA